MPYRMEYVEPEVAVAENEITIYHTYKDDDADHPLEYWFSLDEDGEQRFDVRLLPNWRNYLPPLLTLEDFPEGMDSPGYKEAERQWKEHHRQEPGKILMALREAVCQGIIHPGMKVSWDGRIEA